MADANDENFCGWSVLQNDVDEDECGGETFPWEIVAASLNVTAYLALVVLCIFPPANRSAEPEEFKIDAGLIGWRPLKDEQPAEPIEATPKLDHGWRPTLADVGTAMPEDYAPDWGWRPLPKGGEN